MIINNVCKNDSVLSQNKLFYKFLYVFVAPDVVTEFETIRYSYNKVYLRWKRPLKIHGNLQKFTIIYKNITDRYESEVTDQLNNMTFYHTLDFLKPDSIYEINVYAHSKGAVSKPSQTVTVTTQKFTGMYEV